MNTTIVISILIFIVGCFGFVMHGVSVMRNEINDIKERVIRIEDMMFSKLRNYEIKNNIIRKGINGD